MRPVPESAHESSPVLVGLLSRGLLDSRGMSGPAPPSEPGGHEVGGPDNFSEGRSRAGAKAGRAEQSGCQARCPSPPDPVHQSLREPHAAPSRNCWRDPARIGDRFGLSMGLPGRSIPGTPLLRPRALPPETPRLSPDSGPIPRRTKDHSQRHNRPVAGSAVKPRAGPRGTAACPGWPPGSGSTAAYQDLLACSWARLRIGV
jgi:hypothetical protein